MSAIEINKLVGAILTAGLIFMVINVGVDEMLREDAMEKPDYPVPAAAIEARAKANADKILAFASRRAEEIKSEGVRATTRIFEQIGPEDAELFHFMKSIDALDAIFQQGTTFFLDTRTELFRVFSDRPGAIETKSREQQ